MKILQISIFVVAVAAAMSGAQGANLETCDGIEAVKTRIACDERNIGLVNKTLELVAADVRDDVRKLQDEVGKIPPTLSDDLKKINQRLDEIVAALAQKADKSAMGNYLARNSVVRLRNQNWTGQCLDNATQNASYIQGVGCNDHPAQKWQLE